MYGRKRRRSLFMEKNEVKSGNIVLGTVGALIGGAIGTLPWVLCYVYANMMWSIMAVFIAIGAFKGYELLKGKIDKKVPYIIGVISILCVSIATLVVIPYLLLLKEYGQASFELVKALYEVVEFKSAMIQDYIYSLLFTVLGISGIFSSIKRSIEAGDEKIDWRKPLYSPSDEDIEAVKEAFKKVGALDKDHTIDKEALMKSVKGKENVLNFLIARGIVVRKKGQYYYSEEVEANPGKRTAKIIALTFLITILVIIAVAILVAALS